MQELFERKFPPFAERFEKLCELYGKTREETASLLGMSIQGINKGIRENNTPRDRVLLVELLIERGETRFQSAGDALETTIRAIVKDEIGILAKKLPATTAAEVSNVLRALRKPESEPQSPPVFPQPGDVRGQ